MAFRLILLLFIFLLGCAKNPSPQTLEWYNSQTQRWVDAVVRSCDATHDNFVKGISPVDCLADFPIDLHMSFPTKEFLGTHREGVVEYLSHWCSAVSARTGGAASIQIYLREEGVRQTLPCPRKS